ncbi:MAG: S-layer homology domain-containing protein [Armatimonadota bacterium]|nr:S-layer homology domain-containing protein [Armatimonadota bacterium]
MKTLLVVVVLIAGAGISFAAEQPFKDVPADHWAAEAVQSLKEKGIVNGYSDGTFRGDKPVTRYELAVLLVRFTDFLTETLGCPTESKQGSPAMTDPSNNKTSARGTPGAHLRNEPAKTLLRGGFIPQNSPLLTQSAKLVTMEEVAEALASISMRLIELKVPNEGPDSVGTAGPKEHGNPSSKVQN